ncbi:response regulator transcription factor [Acetatifactor muris]|uniref:Stage 0 sporulation protein A homolog n=1 Tax=Acetatifactor muris TaxID=879566 RepID=A0A2K4ZL32_9FIRM|nr:response regulator transcription factor [Acetatifactor muris]MCR2049422.1 response regulator transcription factor [Acetatifactor muris]SOY31150.1 Phosphate regulon transcriptional regulatory protein PhoB [Acetatifactor muris]
MNNKLLIVEDETSINKLLADLLSEEGYLPVQAYSGTEALLLLEAQQPDLILLDLMLPGLSGEELLQKIRTELNCDIPVLILSAKGDRRNKVNLLKTGADDYIEKPFEPDEVIARIQAALRRGGTTTGGQKALRYKEVKLYPESRKVTVNDNELALTAHEYELLFLLLQNPGKVYSRENLYELVWQGGYYGENNTVNVHVSNLRKKIRDAGCGEEYIRTVYGIGFKLG